MGEELCEAYATELESKNKELAVHYAEVDKLRARMRCEQKVSKEELTRERQLVAIARKVGMDSERAVKEIKNAHAGEIKKLESQNAETLLQHTADVEGVQREARQAKEEIKQAFRQSMAKKVQGLKAQLDEKDQDLAIRENEIQAIRQAERHAEESRRNSEEESARELAQRDLAIGTLQTESRCECEEVARFCTEVELREAELKAMQSDKRRDHEEVVRQRAEIQELYLQRQASEAVLENDAPFELSGAAVTHEVDTDHHVLQKEYANSRRMLGDFVVSKVSSMDQKVQQVIGPGTRRADGRVTEGLFVGGEVPALDENWLRRNDVRAVLSLIRPCPRSEDLYKKLGIYHCISACEDSVAFDIAAVFPTTHQFLDSMRNKQASTLVHCHAGKNRSVAVAISWLMRQHMQSAVTGNMVLAVESCMFKAWCAVAASSPLDRVLDNPSFQAQVFMWALYPISPQAHPAWGPATTFRFFTEAIVRHRCQAELDGFASLTKEGQWHVLAQFLSDLMYMEAKTDKPDYPHFCIATASRRQEVTRRVETYIQSFANGGEREKQRRTRISAAMQLHP